MFTIGECPVLKSPVTTGTSSQENTEDKLNQTFTTESKEDLLNKTFTKMETSSPRPPTRRVRCNSGHLVVEYQVEYTPTKWDRFKSYCKKKSSRTRKPAIKPPARHYYRRNKVAERMVTLSFVAVILTICFVWMFADSDPIAGRKTNKVVDMSYTLINSTVFWPSVSSFQLEPLSRKRISEDGIIYQANKFCVGEHAGTHLDAPSYFLKGQFSVDEIPITHLVAPAVVIDISQKTSNSSNTSVTLSDVLMFEKSYGLIPKGAIVFMFSGWGQYWYNETAYYGNDRGDFEDLHFPGISPEVAEWVVTNRDVVGFASDTPSLDSGHLKDFVTSKILAAHNIYGLVNVANLEQLPPIGARVIVMPLAITGGSASPTRVVAELN